MKYIKKTRWNQVFSPWVIFCFSLQSGCRRCMSYRKLLLLSTTELTRFQNRFYLTKRAFSGSQKSFFLPRQNTHRLQVYWIPYQRRRLRKVDLISRPWLPSWRPGRMVYRSKISKLGTYLCPHYSLYTSRTRDTGFLVGFLTLEYGTDRLSRNVGKELPLLTTS
jgi:hypothetical protein